MLKNNKNFYCLNSYLSWLLNAQSTTLVHKTEAYSKQALKKTKKTLQTH